MHSEIAILTSLFTLTTMIFLNLFSETVMPTMMTVMNLKMSLMILCILLIPDINLEGLKSTELGIIQRMKGSLVEFRNVVYVVKLGILKEFAKSLLISYCLVIIYSTLV